MNLATCIISIISKFDSGLSQLLHDKLHWLNITNRVQFKFAMLMYQCLHETAPPYLVDSCIPTADVTGHQYLRSASHRKLIVLRYHLNIFGC